MKPAPPVIRILLVIGHGYRITGLWIRSEPDPVFALRVRPLMNDVWTAERRFPT